MEILYRTDKCSPQKAADENEARDLDRLVFASCTVGLSSITTANVGEWLIRVLIWNRHFDLDLLGPGELAVIRRWIGLRTSSIEETREKWLVSLLQPSIEQAETISEEALKATA